MQPELNDLIERVNKCEEAIFRQDEDKQRTVERITGTKESDDGLKISSRGNGQPGPRIGE